LLRDTELLLRDTELLLRDTELLLRDTELLLRDTELLLRDTELLLRDTELLLRDTDTELLLRDTELFVTQGHIIVELKSMSDNMQRSGRGGNVLGASRRGSREEGVEAALVAARGQCSRCHPAVVSPPTTLPSSIGWLGRLPLPRSPLTPTANGRCVRQTQPLVGMAREQAH
ncbi:unnamed protein product, partial [Staurois parvus]